MKRRCGAVSISAKSSRPTPSLVQSVDDARAHHSNKSICAAHRAEPAEHGTNCSSCEELKKRMEKVKVKTGKLEQMTQKIKPIGRFMTRRLHPNAREISLSSESLRYAI